VSLAKHPAHMVRSSRLRLRVSGLALALLLVSCTTSQPYDDLLRGTPCAVPCWQGIMPGESGEASVLDVISDPNLVIQDSIARTTADDLSAVEYHFRSRAGKQSVRIHLQDGVVFWIWIDLDHLTLGDMLGTFIEPDFVYVIAQCQDRLCYGPDLYDLTNGIRLTGAICKGDAQGRDDRSTPIGDAEGNTYANIFPEMDANSIYLFVPGPDLESTLVDALLIAPERAREIAGWAYPWTGFGPYGLPHNRIP
jgi:hypothetical protein